MAWSDRAWVLDGASVRVSIIGFDDGQEREHTINGLPVNEVHPDLSASLNLTVAQVLQENRGIAYMGDVKVGPFDIDAKVARHMLAAQGNPNGRSNSDVVLPWINGLDITRRHRDMWVIDFGTNMTEAEAALYEMPFEYAKQHIKPFRLASKSNVRGIPWWLHLWPRPAMRTVLAPLSRYIATPTVAKHRLFSWVEQPTLPDHQLIVIGRDDDYFFGVLHSKIHELWALRMGTSLEDRPRYTPTTTFETFPFPWAPGKEPVDDLRVIAIGQAAKELVEKRDQWLNPEGADEATLKKRTLTNLYNERPTWLDLAHQKLDLAVLDAYGWSHDVNDEEILGRLLALNLEQAAGRGT